MTKKVKIALVILCLTECLFLMHAVYKNIWIKQGTPVTLQVQVYDPSDIMRGRYMAIRPISEVYESKQPYTTFIMENGKTVSLTRTKQPPTDTTVYAYECIIERYYLNEKLADIADGPLRQYLSKANLSIHMYVRSGNYIVTGLYVEDERLEDILRAYKPTEI